MAREDRLYCLSWSKLALGVLLIILALIFLWIVGNMITVPSSRCKVCNPCEVGMLRASDGTCTVARREHHAPCRSACYHANASLGICECNECIGNRAQCKGYCSASGLSFSTFYEECPRLPYDDTRLDTPAADFGMCLAHSCTHVVFHGFTDEATEWLDQSSPEMQEDCFKLRNFDFAGFFPPGFAIARYRCAPFDFKDLLASEMESQMAASPLPNGVMVALDNPSDVRVRYSAWAMLELAKKVSGSSMPSIDTNTGGDESED